jgi:hypothetical protein
MVAVALGWISSLAAVDLWYVGAGLAAAVLLNAKTWTPPTEEPSQ